MARKLYVGNLPYDTTDSNYATQMAYWGSQNANIVEGAGMPYKLSYRVTDNGNTWGVIVTAVPYQAAGVQGANSFYQGTFMRQKKVEYVASIPK